MPIKLFSTEQIPEDIIFVLKKEHEFISSCNYIDELLDKGELKDICCKMNNLCLDEGIIGVHYTKAVRNEIEVQGLTLGLGENRRKIFLENHGNLFTGEQRDRIQTIWNKYFNESQRKVRDNRICFNFTFEALKNGGAKRLLEYYGGEQIYMPLTNDEDICSILRTIGESLVLKCALDATHTNSSSK